MEWSDLLYLLELHRSGTLAGAARVLRVNHTTVSRRLAALEESLGVSLVLRTTDGLRLTQAGEAVLETARIVEANCLALQRRIAGGDTRPEGLVRVTTTEGFAPLLMTAFAQLRVAYPEVQVDVIASHTRLDLGQGEADIAVRLFPETQPDLVVRSLGWMGWSLYASSDYVARHGLLGDDLELKDHDIVGYDPSITTPGSKWLAQAARHARVVVRCNSTRSVATAVSAGMGVSVLPYFVASTDPQLRRLTPQVVTRNEVWSVHHPDLRWVLRIRVVLDHLVAFFQTNGTLLAGES